MVIIGGVPTKIISYLADSSQLYARYLMQVMLFLSKHPMRGKNELSRKLVIAPNGYCSAGMIHFLWEEKNGTQLETAKGMEAAFQMLKSERADYLASNAVTGLKSEVVTRYPIHLVLSKSWPEAVKTMTRRDELARGQGKEFERWKKWCGSAPYLRGMSLGCSSVSRISFLQPLAR